jgi:hypothetical protein
MSTPKIEENLKIFVPIFLAPKQCQAIKNNIYGSCEM